jgi:hypothetical protein
MLWCPGGVSCGAGGCLLLASARRHSGSCARCLCRWRCRVGGSALSGSLTDRSVSSLSGVCSGDRSRVERLVVIRRLRRHRHGFCALAVQAAKEFRWRRNSRRLTHAEILRKEPRPAIVQQTRLQEVETERWKTTSCRNCKVGSRRGSRAGLRRHPASQRSIADRCTSLRQRATNSHWSVKNLL